MSLIIYLFIYYYYLYCIFLRKPSAIYKILLISCLMHTGFWNHIENF